MNKNTKPFVIAMAFLVAIAAPAQSQMLKHFERKARKAFRKEAYSMALYYSTAIIRLDNQNLNAHYWAKQSAEKLNLVNAPDDLTAWLPEKREEKTTMSYDIPEKEHKPDGLDSALLLPSWKLPLALYFDHKKPLADQPADSTTNLTYEQIWIEYLHTLKSYANRNKADSTQTINAKAQYETSLFFTSRIDAQFHKLESFCGLLETYLSEGKKITLKIEGHANQHEGENKNALIKRRINSIENYFSFYKNGFLETYISTKQLQFKRIFLSQKNIDKNITENRGNKNIEYCIENAKTRRVVILLEKIH